MPFQNPDFQTWFLLLLLANKIWIIRLSTTLISLLTRFASETGRACKSVNAVTPPRAACKIKCATCFVPCLDNVVYEIPLTCGAVYIEQTGRLLNELLGDDSHALRVGTGSHLVYRCKARDCTPLLFESTNVLNPTWACARAIFMRHA